MDSPISNSATAPEISLITSWYVHPIADKNLIALRAALRERLNLFDLYFLGNAELLWYLQIPVEKDSNGKNRVLRDLRRKQWDKDGNISKDENDCEIDDGTISFQYPLDFVSSLQVQHLHCIATRLHALMAENYAGAAIGPRPRFPALASYWPTISIPVGETGDDTYQFKAIKAIRNSLFLAAALGSHAVEIVGGAGVPEEREIENSTSPQEQEKFNHEPSSYRELRRLTLCHMLCTVFLNQPGQRIYDHKGNELKDKNGNPILDEVNPLAIEKLSPFQIPFLALEVEPGRTFLINHLDEYGQIKDALKDAYDQRTKAGQQFVADVPSLVRLNVDTAHLILCKHRASHLERYEGDIVHMHLSDHEMTHASDLPPGTFHFYPDYKEWLELACRLCSENHQEGFKNKDGSTDMRPVFSRVIAIEMESCNDIHEAARAVSKTRRWANATAEALEKARRDAEKLSNSGGSKPQISSKKSQTSGSNTRIAVERGCILVTDLGNSTAALMGGFDDVYLKNNGEMPSEYLEGYDRIVKVVGDLCQKVMDGRGSVLSYTGDGCIAFFPNDQFLDKETAAVFALKCEAGLRQVIREILQKSQPKDKKHKEQAQDLETRICLRTSLHYGDVYIPSSGRLMHQIIGPTVVTAARLCDWIAKTIEPAVPKRQRRTICAMTDRFYDLIAKNKEFKDEFTPWGKVELKGVGKQSVYIEKTYQLNQET